MTEITSEQFEKYIGEIQTTFGSLNKFLQSAERDRRSSSTGNSKKNSSSDNNSLSKLLGAKGTLERDLRKGAKVEETRRDKFGQYLSTNVRKAASGIGMLDGSSRGMARSMVEATKSFAGMAIIGSMLENMVEAGEHWVSHYREMTDVGQTFNGSMIDMARAAAQAGLPLHDFAAYVKKNSVLMASFGVRDVTQFAKQVRTMSRHAGNYGFTVDQMNDLSATWLDMQRVQGNRSAAANTANVYAVDMLARRMSGLSEAFGISREEILKNTKELSNSGEMIAAQLLDPTLKMNKAFQAAEQVMAAFPGAGGDAFRGLFQNQMANGAVWMDDNFKNMFNQVGINVEGMMADLDKTIRANSGNAEVGGEAAMKANYAMADAIQRAAPTINSMAAVNPQLRQMLVWSTETLSRTKDQRMADLRKAERNAGQMDKVSALMLTIGDRMDTFKGKMLDGVLAGLQGFIDMVAPIADHVLKNVDWESFAGAAKSLGGYFGTIVKNILESFGKTNPWVIAETIKRTVDAALLLGKGAFMLGGYVLRFIEGFQQLFGGFSGAIVGATATLYAFSKLKTFVQNLFGSRVGSMNVAAGVVNVNGAGLGGMLGGGGGAAAGLQKAEGSLGKRMLGWVKGNKLAAAAAAVVVAAGASSYFDSKAEPSKAVLGTEYDQRQWQRDMLGETQRGNKLTEQQLSQKDEFQALGLNQVAVDGQGRPLNIVNGVPDISALVDSPSRLDNQQPATKPAPESSSLWTKALGTLAVLGGLGVAAKKYLAGTSVGRVMGKMTGGLGGILRHGSLPITAAFEGYDYIAGDRALTTRNLSKSALRVGGTLGGSMGGAYLGGMLGAGATVETGPGAVAGGGVGAGIGSLIGGAVGYNVADSFAQWLLGNDDKKGAVAAPAEDQSLITDSKRTADTLEQRLASPEQVDKDMSNNAAILRALQQMNNIQEGILVKGWEHKAQLQVIAGLLGSIIGNTSK